MYMYIYIYIYIYIYVIDTNLVKKRQLIFTAIKVKSGGNH